MSLTMSLVILVIEGPHAGYCGMCHNILYVDGQCGVHARNPLRLECRKHLSLVSSVVAVAGCHLVHRLS